MKGDEPYPAAQRFGWVAVPPPPHPTAPGRPVRGKYRIAPTNPELLALEARGELCEDDDCQNVLCYGSCCFPPEDYGELNRAICHDHLRKWGFRKERPCPTCAKFRNQLREHERIHVMNESTV